MSENAQGALPRPLSESYTAHFRVGDATVHVTAGSLSAVADVIARLRGTDKSATTGVSAAEKQAVAEPVKVQAAAPKPEAPGKSAPPAAPAASSPTAAAAAPAAAPASDAPKVTYPDVAKAITAVYNKDPDAAAAVLAGFKAEDGKPVTHGKNLRPADYADVIAACKAKVDELEKAPA